MKSIIIKKLKKIKQKISIKSVKEKFYFLDHETLFFILILVLSTSTAYILGKYSAEVENKNMTENRIVKINSKKVNEVEIIASKNGSVYHLPWCSGAIKMSDKNKIIFKNEEKAKNAGYRPAKNCDGL